MATRFVHRGTELEAVFVESRDTNGQKLQKWVSGRVAKVEERYRTYVRALVDWKVEETSLEPVAIDLWNCDFNNKNGVTPWRFANEAHTDTVESMVHAVDEINNRLKDIMNLHDKMITPSRYITDSDSDVEDDERATTEESAIEDDSDSDYTSETVTDSEEENTTVKSPETATGSFDIDKSFFQPINIILVMTTVLMGIRLYEVVVGVRL